MTSKAYNGPKEQNLKKVVNRNGHKCKIQGISCSSFLINNPVSVTFYLTCVNFFKFDMSDLRTLESISANFYWTLKSNSNASHHIICTSNCVTFHYFDTHLVFNVSSMNVNAIFTQDLYILFLFQYLLTYEEKPVTYVFLEFLTKMKVVRHLIRPLMIFFPGCNAQGLGSYSKKT